MSDKDRLLDKEAGKGPIKDIAWKDATKAPWYFGTGFIIFWMLLFFAVVIPLFYRLPAALSIDDGQTGEFIGERAYNTLNNLVNIGPKVLGTDANEVDAVLFLLNEIADITKNLLTDRYTIEIDVQKTSGAHIYSNMLEVYQEAQNVVVKLSPKNSTSDSYLLLNSHYDTVLTSPGAGDDGFMVAVMLEVLRVMATTHQNFEHPIVFLFNGDEEMGLQASHGFITQHKWAANCKAVINLDAGGSGGRDILFQTGPSHSWLANYYKKSAKHPFATTLAEEIFQAGLIPSDTDYRIFVEHGNIPGVDISQFINGYVYHTKYDRTDVIPRGSIQNTGDNVLGLVKALANAPELRDIKDHEEGRAIFFDYLGLFFISYSVETGNILNYSVVGVTLLLIFISMLRMSALSLLSCCQVIQQLIITLIIQIIAFVLALALPLVVAHYFDSFGLSLTYFSSPYLLIGLYIFPSLIGLSLPLILYCQSVQQNKLPTIYHLQLALHSWAIILSLLLLGMTTYGLRSGYFFTISIIFYTIPLIINLITTFHDRGFSWAGTVMSFQVIPYLYISSLIYTLYVALTPTNGRAGSASNPDIMTAGLTALGTMLCFGFLAPLINMFRRPSIVVFSLFLVSVVTMYLASSTQIGFPYRPKTNTERVMYQHVRRIFYEYDGTVSRDESGYLFNFQDRREEQPYAGVNLTGSVRTKSECDKHMMCGLPYFDERWVGNRFEGMWLPREEPIEPPIPVTLELLSKTVLDNNKTARFEFRLKGPQYMSLYIQPNEDDFVSLSNWTFSQTYLENPPPSPLTYHIYISYGSKSPSLDFTLDLSKLNGNYEVPVLEIGASGHCLGNKGDEISQSFATTFPHYAIVVDWPSTYKRYIF
ncbi:endoplasmic reticulum metallopeptidase 1-like [Drosophila albomicans]|uniref:FXNA-like protease n=1 Tax=Drosophila albomicans TaxID=7291 RepID=A0A6P8X8K0_DROAB|nr:endoplasmic reticulum metallopeptidase 1-like [Drosophila albomicans]